MRNDIAAVCAECNGTTQKIYEGYRCGVCAGIEVTVLKDESLGGIEREYREVKRKAKAGERIKIVDGVAYSAYENGDTFVVEREDSDGCIFITDNVGDEEGVFDEEYAVLEPSDIVRINTPDGDGKTARFRMVDRKAAVGERVIALVGCDRFYRAGDVGRLTGLGVANFTGNDYVYGDGIWAVEEYHVLEQVETAQQPEPLSAKPAPDQAAEIIAKLTGRVASLERRVTMLELANVKPIPRRVAKPAQHPSFAKCAIKSPQEIRDDIVKRAKEDVADLRKFAGTNVPNDSVKFWPRVDKPTTYVPMHTVKYVVNREKRTVVAIIRCTSDGHITRGIAKCAPGDVFNASIGRTIALRRALGLEIPEEYVSAPQPTEVRVGDVVRYRSNRVATVVAEGPFTNQDTKRFTYRSTAVSYNASIIDDSREDSAELRKEVA